MPPDSTVSQNARYAIVIVSCLLLTIGIGIAAGLLGPYALAILAGLIVIGLITVNPLLGAMVLVATVPLQAALSVGSGVTGTRLLGLFVFAVWATRKLARRESWSTIMVSGVTYAAAAFAVIVLLSMTWAEFPTRVRTGFLQLGWLILFYFLILDVCRSVPDIRWVVRSLAVGGCAAAFLTLNQYFGGGAIRAGAGIGGGINATAVVLLTVVPLGFYMLRADPNPAWRLVGVAYVGLGCMAIAVSFSRMNFLLLPVVLIAMSWHTIRGRRGRGLFFALAVFGALGLVKYVPWVRVLSRAETIAPYLSGTFGSEIPGTGQSSGRGYHLKVGFEIARDHPLLGVGYNNYGEAFIEEYQFQVLGADRLYDTARSPHSSHVGILADLGLVGFSAWIAILGIALVGLVKTLRLARSSGQEDVYVLVQCLLYCLGLQVFAYGWYLPNQKAKILWALLGLSVAVHAIARERAERWLAASPNPRSDPGVVETSVEDGRTVILSLPR